MRPQPAAWGVRSKRRMGSLIRFLEAQALGERKPLCNRHLARAARERQRPPRTSGNMSRTAARLLRRSIGSTGEQFNTRERGAVVRSTLRDVAAEASARMRTRVHREVHSLVRSEVREALRRSARTSGAAGARRSRRRPRAKRGRNRARRAAPARTMCSVAMCADQKRTGRAAGERRGP